MKAEKRQIGLGPVTINQEISRVLLVFPVEDGQSEAFMWACRKGGYKASIVNGVDAALDALEKKRHHIVVVDMRVPVASVGEQVVRRIRSKPALNGITTLAVCPAILRWCEEPTVRPYLEMGFNRRYLENHDRGACLNEIVMIDNGEVQTALKLSVANTLFQLLRESKESIDITDADGMCSYVNPAFEKLTGFKSSDIVGSSTDVLVNEERTAQGIQEQISRAKTDGRGWDGMVFNNRQGQEPVAVDMKILPVFDGEMTRPSHFVTCRQEANPICRNCYSKAGGNSTRRMSNGRVRTESSNTSINSLSNSQRRYSKQVDAPIIKILGMLRNLQDTSPQLPPNLIDNMMAMLRSSELYTAGSTSLTEDPEAQGFMDGLMEGRNTRPSLTGETILSHRESMVAFSSSMMALPVLIKDNLAKRKEWDYDIFELEKLSNHRPLYYLGFDILVEFGILNIFKIEETTLKNWLALVESHYRTTNSYHNSTHASDVLQAAAYFCRSECMETCLDPIDFLSLLIASICHDIDHPGRTNTFLCNTQHELAVLYNDSAVLESHHAAHAFKITCQAGEQQNVDIFKNLDADTFKAVRKSIISMILATDMTQHFEYYNKFIAVNLKVDGEGGEEMQLPASQENKTLILRMAIKCADISNPSRIPSLAQTWAHRIILEYRDQIAEERQRQLPQSFPSLDNIPKSQVMFINLFARDLLSAYYDFLEFGHLTEQLTETFEYWESFDETNPYTFEVRPS